jgi:hypothetical protein
MAKDDTNPSQTPAEDLSTDNVDGQPATQGDDGSKTPAVDPAEQARRDQQSKKDKKASELDETSERLNFLEAREMERVRDQSVSDFLSRHSDKYPDVAKTDPLFKHAENEDAVKEIADEIQNRYKDAEQKALERVQVESDQGLTDEEIAEQEKELEKEVNETGTSRFGNYITNLGRRKN